VRGEGKRVKRVKKSGNEWGELGRVGDGGRVKKSEKSEKEWERVRRSGKE
jgi:hypothetical protein